MEWKRFIDKRIFLKLKDGTVYNGLIIDVGEGFLKLVDKYDQTVLIATSEIIKLVEEGKE